MNKNSIVPDKIIPDTELIKKQQPSVEHKFLGKLVKKIKNGIVWEYNPADSTIVQAQIIRKTTFDPNVDDPKVKKDLKKKCNVGRVDIKPNRIYVEATNEMAAMNKIEKGRGLIT